MSTSRTDECVMERVPRPLKAPKWRNLIFDRCGKSYRGLTIHDSEAAAAAQFRRWERGVLSHKHVTDARWYSESLDGQINSRDYAWGMQIPVWEGS